MEKISPPPRDDEDEYILLEEVEAAVKRMPMNKSPGADEITAEMIKAGGCDLIKQIHDVCNTVWKEGKVPEDTGFPAGLKCRKRKFFFYTPPDNSQGGCKYI